MFSKILYIILGLVIVLFVLNKYVLGGKLSQGVEAPDFTSPLINGAEFQLSSLKGNYVLVDFWGSWCGPCIKENPKLVAFYNKYKDSEFSNGERLHVVSIALEKTNRSWQRMADRFGFNWEYQIVDISRFVLLSPLAKSFNVSEVPSKFLISPDWKIMAANSSFDDMDKLLSRRLK